MALHLDEEECLALFETLDRYLPQLRFELARAEDREVVHDLNELECVDGDVYANVWQTDEILRIDPASGKVTAVIDASNLLSAAERDRTDVLNGIAWDPTQKTFLITGKLWPKLFEVAFVPQP